MGVSDLCRAEWRTSSYSGSNSNCVEVADAPGWPKASRSGSTGDYADVAADSGTRVLVRDAKDRGGPVLAFRPSAWREFASQVRSTAS